MLPVSPWEDICLIEPHSNILFREFLVYQLSMTEIACHPLSKRGKDRREYERERVWNEKGCDEKWKKTKEREKERDS